MKKKLSWIFLILAVVAILVNVAAIRYSDDQRLLVLAIGAAGVLLAGWPGRIAIGCGIILLLSVPVFLSFHLSTNAERCAVWAFFCLALGVAQELWAARRDHPPSDTK